MTKIKFGTDGWRGLIARDFTFDNVALAARAVAETFKQKAPQSGKMIVGHDCRFLSRRFAETCAAVYAEAGYEVLMAETFLPTPALSWCAKHEAGAAGATVITASHNPAEWNGFKFKEAYGGSALPSTTELFERKIAALAGERKTAPAPDMFSVYAREGKIKLFNPMERYTTAIKGLVDTVAIRKAGLKVGVDTMYGAGSGHMKTLLESVGVSVTDIHGEQNPGFRGVPPEPIEKNLKDLCALVKNERLACGFATDGDADRLGAVDENGNYFSTQKILSMCYWHMLKNRKRAWSIARSVSTTKMVDLIAARAGMKSFETPVGFKFIAEKMVNGEAQIGGEESGGVGFIDHIPERDGPLTALMLLDLIASTGKGLAALYADVCKEERPYEFTRVDLHVAQSVMDDAMRRLRQNTPEEWDGRAVGTLLTIDGYKFYMKDGSWLLIRPSGTEPIFRLYAEAESLAASEQLVAAARKFVETP